MPRRRKSSSSRWILVFCVLIVLALGTWFFVRWLAYRKAKFTRYPEFGINIPNEYSIHGIDVSRYQHIIAWEEVAEMQVSHIRIGFVFMKATEGIGNMDVQFPRNWKKSRE